jgi:hypothetical protein
MTKKVFIVLCLVFIAVTVGLVIVKHNINSIEPSCSIGSNKIAVHKYMNEIGYTKTSSEENIETYSSDKEDVTIVYCDNRVSLVEIRPRVSTDRELEDSFYSNYLAIYNIFGLPRITTEERIIWYDRETGALVVMNLKPEYLIIITTIDCGEQHERYY